MPSDRSASDDDSDDRCSDWASDFGSALQTKSLFDDSIFPTPEAAIRYDIEQYQYDIEKEQKRLNCDVYERMRLVNMIRKEVIHHHIVSRRP